MNYDLKTWEEVIAKWNNLLYRYADELDAIEKLNNAKKHSDCTNKKCACPDDNCTCDETESNYNIKYKYTNLLVYNDDQAIEEMRDYLNHWTFTLRCNKNAALDATFIFNKFKYHFSWDGSIGQISGTRAYLQPNTKNKYVWSNSVYIWDELKNAFVDKEDYFAGKFKDAQTSEKKPYTTPDFASVVNTDTDKTQNTYTTSVTDTVQKTEDTHMDSTDKNIYKFTGDKCNTVDTNKFITNITGESLLSKLNSAKHATEDESDSCVVDNVEKYTYPMLKAVEAILELDLYDTIGNNEIFFSTDQIVDMMHDQGVIFNYDNLEDVFTDEQISMKICEAFKIQLVSVNSGIVYCELV